MSSSKKVAQIRLDSAGRMSDLSSWLDSLRIAEVAPKGFTTRDLCRAEGIAERTARDRLRAARDNGTIVHVGFRTETDVMGRGHRVPVYQYVGGKNASQKCTPDHEHNHTGCTFDSCPPPQRKTRRR